MEGQELENQVFFRKLGITYYLSHFTSDAESSLRWSNLATFEWYIDTFDLDITEHLSHLSLHLMDANGETAAEETTEEEETPDGDEDERDDPEWEEVEGGVAVEFLTLDILSHGFVLDRRIEGVDDDTEVDEENDFGNSEEVGEPVEAVLGLLSILTPTHALSHGLKDPPPPLQKTQ